MTSMSFSIPLISSKSAFCMVASNSTASFGCFLGRLTAGPHRAFDVFQLRRAGRPEVVLQLEAQPEFGGGPQVPGQAQRSIRGDAPAAAYDVVEAGSGNAQMLGELVHAHVERPQD